MELLCGILFGTAVGLFLDSVTNLGQEWLIRMTEKREESPTYGGRSYLV